MIGNHSIVVEIKDVNCGMVEEDTHTERERKKERKKKTVSAG